jgi:hypothetical protein
MTQIDLKNMDVWGSTEAQEALRQVADSCQNGLSLDLEISLDGSSFHSRIGEGKPAMGILSVSGKIVDDTVIEVRMELVRGPKNIRVPSGSFFKHLSGMGDKIRLLPPQEETGCDVSSLWVELKAKASPMTLARAAAFLDEVKRLDELARSLQEELPVLKSDSDLKELYKEVADILEPIRALLEDDEIQAGPELVSWAHETWDFLSGSASVAIVSAYSVVVDFALSVLALVSQKVGKSLGQFMPPAINARKLLELARKAPGIVVLPAVRISLGTNPYELGNEMLTLLSALSAANKPVIFTGTLEELQTVFAGGQGARNDPRFPVVLHLPDVALEPLAQFAIRSAGQAVGGLSQRAEFELTEMTLEAINGVSCGEQKIILPMVANKNVNAWSNEKKNTISQAKKFASNISEASETLGGLSPNPRVARKVEVQERFTGAMSDTGLLDYLKEHLWAQDKALEQLVTHLTKESLTRPTHQPLRYCAQGTPGTGKSESAVLLARKLDIPYVIIDAASMPDYHTAASQLLGSGRGIVMSHQPGRLEQCAKHHTGALVEVSDLDHAVPSVRAVLADLFLQLLETGEGQSATGGRFSCANLIFAFTMNLPGGMDEAVRKGIGFHNSPTRQDVSKRVVSEIKMMLSSAFVSRIGSPVLFEPLDGQALAAIVERAVKSAILSAATRLHVRIPEVVLEENLGAKVIASLEASITSFGARALLEHGRSLAANAFVELRQRNDSLEGETLLVSAPQNRKLVIKPV